MTASTHSARSRPVWVYVWVLAVLVAAHTQLTLRHWLLLVSGTRTGRIERVEPGTGSGLAVLHDPFGVYRPGELVGKLLVVGEQRFPVQDNTTTTIVIAALPKNLAALGNPPLPYLAGFTRETGLVRFAARLPETGATVADLLLGCGAGVFLLYLLWRREWSWRLLPPVAAVILLVVCAWSIAAPLRLADGWGQYLSAADRARGCRQGLKEFLQYLEIWGVAFVAFRLAFQDQRLRRVTAAALLGLGAVVVVWGLLEYGRVLTGHTLRGFADVGELAGPFGVRFNPGRSHDVGTEASKNVLATYLLLMLPLWLALAAVPLRGWWRVACVVVAALGLGLVLNAWLLVAALGGLLLVAACWRPVWALPAVLGGAVLCLSLFCLVTAEPGKAAVGSRRRGSHAEVLLDSIALHRQQDPSGLLPMPLKGQGNPPLAGWEPWQQKYQELQAIMNGLSYSPLLGHGLGTYQDRINQFYGQSRFPHLGLSKSPANAMEKDAHGVFWIHLLETGVLGAAALVGLLVWFLRSALLARATAAPFDRALLTGVAGAIVALLLGGWFCSFMVRGVQLLTVALLALATAAADEPTPPFPADAVAGEHQ